MADPLSRVKPGQPFRPSAATWNLLVGLARDRGVGGGGPQAYPVAPTVTVLVRNDTGSPRVAGSVLKLAGVVVDPDDAPEEVRRRPVFAGETPGEPTDPFAVLLESLPEDAIGLALVSGVAVVAVDVTDDAHGFARPDATTGHLVSAPGGPAQILYTPGGTGVLAGCVVLVGASDPMTGEVEFDQVTSFEQDPEAEGCVLVPASWETITIRGLPAGVTIENGDTGSGGLTGTIGEYE